MARFRKAYGLGRGSASSSSSSGLASDASLLNGQAGTYYLARANHTGTQTAATISDFTEAAQDATGAMVDGSLTYVDGTPLLQRAALTGDVTATAGSNATTIANDAVTYAKMQNVSAASRLLGRGDSGSGDPQEIVLGTNLAMSGTTLNATGSSGVDTANSPNAGEFARFTDADTIEGRTVAETKADLDLEIGTDIQAWSANLDEYAAVNPTAAGLALLDDADAAAQRTTLGLGTIATQNDSAVNVIFTNIGCRIADTGNDHELVMRPTENLTADRTLSWTVNDANRSISLSGDLTVAANATISNTNTGDQTVFDGGTA